MLARQQHAAAAPRPWQCAWAMHKKGTRGPVSAKQGSVVWESSNPALAAAVQLPSFQVGIDAQIDSGRRSAPAVQN